MRRMRAAILDLHGACSTADASTLRRAIAAAEAIGLGASDGMRRARAELIEVERLVLASASVDAAIARGSDAQAHSGKFSMERGASGHMRSDASTSLPSLEQSLEWLRATPTSAVRR